MLKLGDCLNKRTSSLNDEMHVSLNRLSANTFSRLIKCLTDMVSLSTKTAMCIEFSLKVCVCHVALQ